jgi:hypothetical protein
LTIAHHCQDESIPDPPYGVAFETTYLDFSDKRQTNADCPTYYQVRFQSRSLSEVDSNGAPLTRTLIIMPPASLLQPNGGDAHFFHFVPDHPGFSQDTVQQVLDFTGRTPQYVRVGMRIVLPNGQRSAWSEWTDWEQR